MLVLLLVLNILIVQNVRPWYLYVVSLVKSFWNVWKRIQMTMKSFSKFKSKFSIINQAILTKNLVKSAPDSVILNSNAT